MKRLAAMHDSPLLMTRAAAACRAACATSASASTMNGSEPPSSRTTFFSARPAIAPTDAPAASLPVSVTALTAVCAASALASAPCTRITVNASSGSPASRHSRSIASAQPVTLEACFSATVFPAASAGTAALKACQ
jgi:hypothetical protein